MLLQLAVAQCGTYPILEPSLYLGVLKGEVQVSGCFMFFGFEPNVVI